MHSMGLLDFRLPVAMRGEVSSIAPTESFASRVRDLGITLADVGRDEREEVLVLTRQAGTRAARATERINYRETPETRALRNAVRGVNAFLAKADIESIDGGLSPHVEPVRQPLEAPLRVDRRRGRCSEVVDASGPAFMFMGLRREDGVQSI